MIGDRFWGLGDWIEDLDCGVGYGIRYLGLRIQNQGFGLRILG